ncbi:MAG: PfkB family carbohydrate kinase [Candidatus Pacearchaeota archaeon]|nr:PfkB family carbohydrate kinase [Candidatus Pacearchaeota archaeon]
MGTIDRSEHLENRKEYLSKFKKKFRLEQLSNNLDSLKNIQVLCIGDAVIDRYVFVNPKGRALKDPILSTRFESEENYTGGVLAVANHLSSYVNRIDLVTLIGDKNPQTEFIRHSLSKNVKPKLFVKPNSPTTLKMRYLDRYRGNKLFKVEDMNDDPISQSLSSEIMAYLSKELPNYGLVLLLDYDHGFLNDEIRKLIQEKSKSLSLNCQVNSANMGYSYVDRYKRADFITMNDAEIRLPMRMQFEDIEKVIDKFYEKLKYPKFLVTTGKIGCTFFDDGKKYSSPTLTDKVVDTVGAGDSVFAITSLFVYSGFNDERVPFIANCVGGIDANILGNKEFVDRQKLLTFIKNLYDGVGNGMG